MTDRRAELEANIAHARALLEGAEPSAAAALFREIRVAAKELEEIGKGFGSASEIDELAGRRAASAKRKG